jgi:hypothetical protein
MVHQAAAANSPVTLRLDFLLGFLCMTSAMGFFFRGVGVWGRLLRFVRFVMTLWAIGVIATIAGVIVSIQFLFDPHDWPKGLSVLTGMALGFAPFARHTWRLVNGTYRPDADLGLADVLAQHHIGLILQSCSSLTACDLASQRQRCASPTASTARRRAASRRQPCFSARGGSAACSTASNASRRAGRSSHLHPTTGANATPR